MGDKRTITNLDGIEALLKTQLKEVTYLSVAERTPRGEEQLAKLVIPPLSDWANASTWGEQADAACQRLRGELLGIADGPRSSFRVGVFGASGRIMMRTCVVLDDDAVLYPTGSPVEEAMAEVGAQGVFQLGASWERFTTVVMKQTDQFKDMCLEQLSAVDKISRAQTELTAKETAAARQQVNTLVGEVTKAKIGVATAKAELSAAKAMGEVETERKEVEVQRTMMAQGLAKDAIGQVSDLGKAFLMSKTGMTPEMTEVFGALQDNPDMVEALKNPKVREQLKNPDNVSFIAKSLTQAVVVTEQQEAAEAAAVAEAAQTTANPPAADGEPPPSGLEPSE